MATDQDRLSYILSEVAKGFYGLYSVDDPKIQQEVRELVCTQQKQSKLKYLALIGHIGSGKDYVANYIAKTLERKCEVVKFATKLTQVTAAILGVDDLSLFQNRSWKEEKQFVWQCSLSTDNATERLISARDAQKIIGTDICRQLLGDNVWVDAFAHQYNDPDTLYIISDLRFENEFQFVQENNGVVVFIENLQAAQRQHQKEYKDGKHQPHASEILTWSLYYEDQVADYRLLNNDYNDPQPLQDLVTFIESI